MIFPLKLFDYLRNRDKFSKELLIEINQTINENILYISGYRKGSMEL